MGRRENAVHRHAFRRAACPADSGGVFQRVVDRGILGCRYGSSRPHRDIPMYVEMAKRGQLLLEPLISKRYTLDEFDAAVADLRAGNLSRGVFIL